jgi:hypothetical protein
MPFDTWGWVFLAISLLGLVLVSKGDWLGVFGALLVRQWVSSLDKNKALTIILFAAMVITCGYESIISSHLIIPPPIVVARNLKDLVDAGYGILGYGSNGDNKTIYLILRRENISHSSSTKEPPFIPDTYMTSLVKTYYDLYSSCDATGPMPSSIQIDVHQDEMDQRYPQLGIRCHFVKETRLPNEHLITYSGYSPITVETFVSSFQESGILDMLYKFWLYAEYLEIRTRRDRIKYAEEKAEVPFELKDPKIISIFIAWGVLLVAASLVFFLFEFLPSLLKYLYFTLAPITS